MAQYLDKAGLTQVWNNIDNLFARKKNLATINGQAIYGENSAPAITIDLSLYKIVTTLPSTLADININKIYLVKGTGKNSNNYNEYMYLGDTSGTYDANKWELIGSYDSNSIDLSKYETKDDHNTDIETLQSTIASTYATQSALSNEASTRQAADSAFSTRISNLAIFKTVKVTSGSADSSIVANSNESILNLVAGTNITMSTDTTNRKVTIATAAEVNQNAISKLAITNDGTALGVLSATSKTDTFTLSAESPLIFTDLSSTGKEARLGIDSTFNENKIEKITINGTEVSITDKVAKISISDYSLIPATTSVLGGVKVGFTRPTSASELLTSNNYPISITSANHIYTTVNDATDKQKGVMTPAMVSKLNGIAANANNYILPVAKSDTLGGVKIAENGGILITNEAISIDIMSSSHIGGAKLVDSETRISTTSTESPITTGPASRIYPIQLNQNDQLQVYVPWTDNNTTYSVATDSANGLMPKENHAIFTGGVITTLSTPVHNSDSVTIGATTKKNTSSTNNSTTSSTTTLTIKKADINSKTAGVMSIAQAQMLQGDTLIGMTFSSTKTSAQLDVSRYSYDASTDTTTSPANIVATLPLASSSSAGIISATDYAKIHTAPEAITTAEIDAICV